MDMDEDLGDLLEAIREGKSMTSTVEIAEKAISIYASTYTIRDKISFNLDQRGHMFSSMAINCILNLFVTPAPSKLPWIPAVGDSEKLFTDTHSYFSGKGSEKRKFLNLQLQRAFGFTLPTYLPAKFHSMDCMALLNSEDKDINNFFYLYNATYFFVFNKLYTTKFWNSIMIPYKKSIDCNTFTSSMLVLDFFHYNMRLRDPLFCEAKPDECSSASEFLLDPWVLIQLPWHPAIYHQWLAAVLAEVFLAKRELIEFCYWPIPEDLQDLAVELVIYLERMYCRVVLGLRLITWQIKLCPKVDAKVVNAILDLVVLPLLPAIEFCVSKKFSYIAKALKRMAWPAEGREMGENDKNSLSMFNMSINHSNTIYGTEFWGKENLGDFFGTTQDNLDDDIQKLHDLAEDMTENWCTLRNSWSCKIDFLEKELIKLKEGSDPDFLEIHRKYWRGQMHEIKEFFEEKIRPQLSGEVDFSDLPWKDSALYCSRIWGQDYTKSTLLTGISRGDLNVIYNMLCLQVEIELTETVMFASSEVFLTLKEKKNVFLCAANTDGPEMSVGEIEETLHNVETSSNLISSNFIENRISEAYRVDANPDENCPDLGIGYKQVIDVFERRIKVLVFNIYKKSMQGIEKSIFYPDWQLVQYLLPGFVALIGDLATNKNAGDTELSNLILFVHHFIKSFELYLRKQQLDECTLEEPFGEELAERRANCLRSQISYAADELGFCVYGNLKNVSKKHSAHWAMENCNLKIITITLTNRLLQETCKQLFITWTDEVKLYVSRLQLAIREVNLSQSNSPFNKKLLEIFYVIVELKNIATICYAEFSNMSNFLFDQADRRIKILNGKRPNALRDEFKRLDKKCTAEAPKLKLQQILGIILHLCLDSLKKSDPVTRALFLRVQPLQPPLLKSVLDLCLKEEWRQVKLILVPFLSDEHHGDLSLISYDDARKFPRSYKEVLASLKECRGGVAELNSAIPITFCRFCLQYDVELKKCSDCVNNPDFPDIHWFCSDDCERRGLDEGHLNDHDYELMVKCGLFDD